MYLRVVRLSLDSVIVYDTFINMIFDILFVLSYFIYFDRMELSPKMKFTYLLTYLLFHFYSWMQTRRQSSVLGGGGHKIFWWGKKYIRG